MLNNGQKVFVPNYGAGIMTQCEDKKMCDINIEYVSISILVDNIDLYIPKNKLVNYRIRNVGSESTVSNAIKIINYDVTNIEKNWNKRYRQNNDKIRTGDLFNMCEVIRDLYYLKSQGTLPPGERKILCKVENMVASEIAVVFDIKLENALLKIRNLGE